MPAVCEETVFKQIIEPFLILINASKHKHRSLVNNRSMSISTFNSFAL